MNGLQIFSNSEFGEVRTVTKGEVPLFVGNDVAKALGYADSFGALKKHVSSEDKLVCQIDSAGQKRDMTVINESGLYALIFGSKLDSARRFKRWVTSEVLPAVRKTGGYSKPMSPQEMMRVQLGMIDDHEERLETLENTMTVDYGQQQFLKGLVNRIVVEALGGKSAPAYHEISKKVFSECNHDIQDFFQVNSRNNIPRVKYDEAKHYIRHWSPCTNTQMLINSHNAQMAMAI